MLKNKYQEIIVGLSSISLIRGIVSRKKNNSVLLIDDNRFIDESYFSHFLSELEVLPLIRLGKKYDIPELSDIRQFLRPSEVEFVNDKSRLRLGLNPLRNLKELLRKYPELIDPADLDLVYSQEEQEFNRYFISELTRFEELNFLGIKKANSPKFELQGPKWFKSFYTRFEELINQEYEKSKNLKFSAFLHLLGIFHEEKLKISLSVNEVPFYFFRTLSPVYRLHDFFLCAQLKRRLSLLGGDYKQSAIQFWQIYENRFENLLLATFEGVISGNKVLFFSHLPEDVPFSLNSPFKFFRKIKVTPNKRAVSPFPPDKLTIISDVDLLGSDRPYRVVSQGQEFAFYHWPYPSLKGSKSEFYSQELAISLESDSQSLPFRYDQCEIQNSSSLTLDLRSAQVDKNIFIPVLKTLPLEIHANDKLLKGFEYWGPFRYYTQGLLPLVYGIEDN